MDSFTPTDPAAGVATHDSRRIGLAGVAALGLAVALVITLGLLSRLSSAAPASPLQVALPPASAPLPQFDPGQDARSMAWILPMTFSARAAVSFGTAELVASRARMQVAPPQLLVETFDRAGNRLGSSYHWHPLRVEHAIAPVPTPQGPRLTLDGPGGLTQAGQPWEPWHRIMDSGTGRLVLPYDPRVSSVRIVDATLGGVELGRASLEGAARRYCAAAPEDPFCREGRASPGALYFEPYSTTVTAGDIFTVELKARRMAELYGGQTAVTFDPQVLQVVDQDGSRPGAQVGVGDFPVPDSVLRNIADNAAGRLEYYFTLTGAKPGVSGQGTVANLVFRAAGEGQSVLAITQTVLSDPQSLAIPVKEELGLVTVSAVPIPRASVQGTVELERRPSNAGALVCSSGTCVTTDAAGRYLLENVPVGQMVHVTHRSYLRAQRLLPATATGTVTWPAVRLLAGDLDQDDRVDIVDAVMIGQRFNLRFDPANPPARWLPACDITTDDVVNVLDMVAVQFNFLEEAPGQWPATQVARPSEPEAAHSPAQSARVDLVPAQASADGPGQDVHITVRASGVSDLYGYRFRLRFDPSHLAVVDQSRTEDGIQVAIGDMLDPLNNFILVNRADNEAGIIDVSVTQTFPAEAVTGDGVLAVVTFRGRAAGTSSVDVTELYLVDNTLPVPNVIPSERAGANVTIGSQPPSFRLFTPRVQKP